MENECQRNQYPHTDVIPGEKIGKGNCNCLHAFIGKWFIFGCVENTQTR